MIRDPLDELEDNLVDGEDSDESEDVQSRTTLLQNYMSALGYRPQAARVDSTIEYAKVLSDPSGRLGRIVSVIKLDQVGLEPERPEYFTVTTQVYVRATKAEIERSSPSFARNDLLRILSHFNADAATTSKDTPYVCEGCGAKTDEHIVSSGREICFGCARRSGL